MSFFNPFSPKPRGVEVEIARVKALVRDVLGLADDTGVTVSEIVCRDAACPGLETAILILPPGGSTRLLRIPGSMAAVERHHVIEGDREAEHRGAGGRPTPR